MDFFILGRTHRYFTLILIDVTNRTKRETNRKGFMNRKNI